MLLDSPVALVVGPKGKVDLGLSDAVPGAAEFVVMLNFGASEVEGLTDDTPFVDGAVNKGTEGFCVVSVGLLVVEGKVIEDEG